MDKQRKASFIGRASSELLTAGVILFAASLLIEASPIAAVEGIFPETVEKKEMSASLDISPFKAGTNDMTIQFQNAPDFKQVNVEFFMPPDWQIEHKAFSLGDGTYKLTGNFAHASGTMYVDVIAIKPNGEKIVFPFRIVIPGEIRQFN